MIVAKVVICTVPNYLRRGEKPKSILRLIFRCLFFYLAEFEPNQTSTDDEETIEAEERGNSLDVIDCNKEIEMLKRESELPLEDLVSQLPEGYLNNVEGIVKPNKVRYF